ncbi:MAG: DUF3105 domain-containing protein [Actinomycetota bacterium]
MADRREEKERLRQIREEAEKRETAEQRRKLFIGYGVAGVLTAAVVLGIVIVVIGSSGGGGASGGAHINATSGSTNGVPPDDRTGTPPPPVKVSNLKLAAKKAGCVLRLGLPDEGHTHIPPDSPNPDYKTNPPTSGTHVDVPFQQADGAYLEEPKEIFFVHSLEHGRMEIQYSPKLAERDQLALRGLYDTLYGGTLLFPNKQMPYKVAATTWTNLIGCKTYKGPITLDAVRDFGKTTWGRFGSEPVAAFPFTGPTPATPSG